MISTHQHLSGLSSFLPLRTIPLLHCNRPPSLQTLPALLRTLPFFLLLAIDTYRRSRDPDAHCKERVDGSVSAKGSDGVKGSTGLLVPGEEVGCGHCWWEIESFVW